MPTANGSDSEEDFHAQMQAVDVDDSDDDGEANGGEKGPSTAPDDGQRLIDAYAGDAAGLEQHLRIHEVEDVPPSLVSDPVAMAYIRSIQRKLVQSDTLVVDVKLEAAKSKVTRKRMPVKDTTDGSAEKGKKRVRGKRTERFTPEQLRISDAISDVARPFAFTHMWPIGKLNNKRPDLPSFVATTSERYKNLPFNDFAVRLEEIYARFDDNREIQQLIGTPFFGQEWCHFMNDQRSKFINEVKNVMHLWYSLVESTAWGSDKIRTDPEAVRLRGPLTQIMDSPFLYPPGAVGDLSKVLLVESLPLSLRFAFFGSSSLHGPALANTKGMDWGVYLEEVTLQMIASMVAAHAHHLSRVDRQFTVKITADDDKVSQEHVASNSEPKPLDYLQIWRIVHEFLLNLGDTAARRTIVQFWTRITFKEWVDDGTIGSSDLVSSPSQRRPDDDFLARFLAHTNSVASTPVPDTTSLPPPAIAVELSDSCPTGAPATSGPSARRITSPTTEVVTAVAIVTDTLGGLALADTPCSDAQRLATAEASTAAQLEAPRVTPKPRKRNAKKGAVDGDSNTVAPQVENPVADVGVKTRTRSSARKADAQGEEGSGATKGTRGGRGARGARG